MKTLATLTAASLLALAGAAAIAQTAAPPPVPAAPPPVTAPPAAPPAPEAPRGPWLSRADLDALTDARIAGIQAGLRLNPEQQRLWAPVEQALRARAAERAERIEERRRMMREDSDRRGPPEPALDITQRLDRQAERATRRAQRVTERAQRLTALATAMRPFYASLDENQKRLLPVLMREGRYDGHDMGMHHRGGRDRMGYGRYDRMDHHPMMGRDRGMMDRGPQRFQ